MATTVRATAEEFGEENVLARQLWQRMNFPDKVYGAWFLALSLALLLTPHQAGNWPRYLLLNIVILEVIALSALKSPASASWRITHDWYPMLLFIVAFEEIARLSLAFVHGWQDAALLRLEAVLFPQPPTTWLLQFNNPFLVELLELGYFSFYWMLPAVGIVLYRRGWEGDEGELVPYRTWMSSLAIGYVVCFATYLLFPTEGPAHTLGHPLAIAAGPFRWLVLLIQKLGGVHGNAFPSGHIMAAVVSVMAAMRFSRRLGSSLALATLLMCIGAVYDGYHYASDVIAGAVLGAIAYRTAVLFENRAHGVN